MLFQSAPVPFHATYLGQLAYACHSSSGHLAPSFGLCRHSIHVADR